MRILQFLFTVIAAAIFLAGIAFWVRGYSAAETAHWEKDHYVVDVQQSSRLTLTSVQGKIHLKYERFQAKIPDPTHETPIYKYSPDGAIIAVVLPSKAPLPPDRSAIFVDAAPVPSLSVKQLAFQTVAAFNFASSDAPTANSYALTLPAWILVAVASIFPLGQLERLVRRFAGKKAKRRTRSAEMFPV